jgi:L-asparagine oxygenase
MLNDTRSIAEQEVLVTRLTEAEHDELGMVAGELKPVAAGLIDTEHWVTAARSAASRMPLSVRAAIRGFRRDPGKHGVLLIRNLPTRSADLPPTPGVFDSVQRTATKQASVLAMIALELGELISFGAEKQGALIQDVVPVRGKETFQGNAGSTTLTMHIENAFHPERPDYVALLCLRNDHDNMAGLRTSSIRQAAELLPETVLNVLSQPRFITEAPASFGGAGAVTAPHAVLEGVIEDADIRVDFASTSPLDDEAAAALAELGEALVQVRNTTILQPGDIAILDNRITLHGRTAFTPRYDGKDRWLQRAFIQLDGRRSRPLRVNDGNVLI